MKYLQLVFLFFFLYSCSDESWEVEILRAYKVESEMLNDSIQINDLKILSILEVGTEYINGMCIKSFLRIIESLELENEYRLKIISSSQKRRNKFGKDSVKIAKDLSKINTTNLKIKNVKKRIDSLTILEGHKIDDGKTYTLIKYRVKGLINKKKISDTLEIIFKEDLNYTFVRNGLMFVGYN